MSETSVSIDSNEEFVAQTKDAYNVAQTKDAQPTCECAKFWYAVILLFGVFHMLSAVAGFIAFGLLTAEPEFEARSIYKFIIAETVFRFWFGATLICVYRNRHVEFAEKHPELSKYLAGLYGMALCVYAVLACVITSYYLTRSDIAQDMSDASRVIIRIGVFYVCGTVAAAALCCALLSFGVLIVVASACVKAISAGCRCE